MLSPLRELRARPLARCEACHTAGPTSTVEASDGPPFQVCRPCSHRLRTFSLRPWEWFNLAAIHGPEEFLLHGDFYDQDGIATAPEDRLEDPERWPAPTLDECATDLERLVAYAMTRWLLEPHVIEALRAHSPEALLGHLQDRVQNTALGVEARAYELCAEAVGARAGPWLRERWPRRHGPAWAPLVRAVAACLPQEEGLRLVLSAVDGRDRTHVERARSLAWFRSELILDWMEFRVREAGTGDWGRLAAASGLSWSRARSWLDRGRPLSLVALDAMWRQLRPDTPLLARLAPALLGAAPLDDMISTLRAHTRRDTAPRVRSAVEAIVREWTRRAERASSAEPSSGSAA
jgi:hypothetical protein